jgi:hypothetical protein
MGIGPAPKKETRFEKRANAKGVRVIINSKVCVRKLIVLRNDNNNNKSHQKYFLPHPNMTMNVVAAIVLA